MFTSKNWSNKKNDSQFKHNVYHWIVDLLDDVLLHLRERTHLMKTSPRCLIISCPEQLNRWPCPLVGWTQLTIKPFTTLPSDPRDLWPLRHLIREMERHEKNTFWQIQFDKYILRNTFGQIYLNKYI